MTRKLFSINKNSLSNQIATVIEEQITNHHYKSGQRILIQELINQFEVSSGPIREALHQLFEKGLIQIQPRVGYFVVTLSKNEIRDIFDTRILLETYALKHLFKNLPLNKIKEQRSKFSRIEESKSEFLDIHQYFRINEKFHKNFLIENCGNNLIIKLYSNVFSLLKLTTHIELDIRNDAIEHLEIIDAIIEKNHKKAKATLTNHLRNSESDILYFIDNLHTPKGAIGSSNG